MNDKRRSRSGHGAHLRRARRRLVEILLFVLILSGCEQPSDRAEQSVELAELLGVPLDAVEAEAENLRLFSIEQGVVASCMSERGFTYVPLAFIESRGDARQRGPAQEMRDAVDEIGLGIEPAEPSDPNLDHIESLPPAERAAWESAMFGGLVDTESQSAEDLGRRLFAGEGTRSCQKDAELAVVEASGRKVELIDEYQLARAAIGNDQRVIEAMTLWSDCMAQHGYQFSLVEEVRDFLEERLDEVMATAASPQDLTEKLDLLVEREVVVLDHHDSCFMDVELARQAVQEEIDAAFLAKHN